MKEFKEIVIGNASLGQWGASAFFAFLAVVGMLAFRVSRRDVNSARTPSDWSWSFFWKDTFAQIIGTVILVFLFIRILQYWVDPKWLVLIAAIVGLISDQLFMIALKIKDRAVYFILKKIGKVEDKVDALQDSVDKIEKKID